MPSSGGGWCSRSQAPATETIAQKRRRRWRRRDSCPMTSSSTSRQNVPLSSAGDDFVFSSVQSETADGPAPAREGRTPRIEAGAGLAEVRPAPPLGDAAMNFLESAEHMFTYHQAELIRLACGGLSQPGVLAQARYVLDRALALSFRRSPALPGDDAFNDSIMDFVERESRRMTYLEAEIVRRAARGCDEDSLHEIAYLLDRAERRAVAAVQA